MDWFGRIWDRISPEWEVIKQAKILFALALFFFAGLGTVAAWAIIEWHHAATESSLQATIGTKDGLIGQLQEELKGTSPQLAAIQAGRDKIRKQLQMYYVQGGDLLNRNIGTKEEMTKFIEDANAWAKAIGDWAMKNMGEAATARIFDSETIPSLVWTNAVSPEYSNVKNYIIGVRRNLSSLIETAAWDGSPAK